MIRQYRFDVVECTVVKSKAHEASKESAAQSIALLSRPAAKSKSPPQRNQRPLNLLKNIRAIISLHAFFGDT
jgi:hypothetical protein